MTRLLFVLAAAALLAPAALAKGPSQASITGPGLNTTIVFKNMEDSSYLTEQAGFFPAVFGQEPCSICVDPVSECDQHGHGQNVGGVERGRDPAGLSIGQLPAGEQARQQRWPEEGPKLNQDLRGADQRDQLPR